MNITDSPGRAEIGDREEDGRTEFGRSEEESRSTKKAFRGEKKGTKEDQFVRVQSSIERRSLKFTLYKNSFNIFYYTLLFH